MTSSSRARLRVGSGNVTRDSWTSDTDLLDTTLTRRRSGGPGQGLSKHTGVSHGFLERRQGKAAFPSRAIIPKIFLVFSEGLGICR